MFTYHQRTGKLEHDRLGLIGFGHSGDPEAGGMDNPAMQNVKSVGPLPVGDYTIGPPEDRPQHTGLYSLALTPWPKNVMFNRGSFYIHGGRVGQALGVGGQGCIEIGPLQRWAVGGAVLGPQRDTHLRVVAE